jgi:WD40 repeat protein
MADIFISHSSNDNEVAAAIGERIKRERPTWSLFYDKDNIRAGQRWQERLREELTSCRVVLALLSRSWLDSHWCFAETVTGTFRGKDVVGIETEDLTSDDLARAPPILHERQRVRLRDGDDRAWQEILEALDRSGLDPNEWFPIPPNAGPYPGLIAFDEKDAGVFFGRKQEITEYLGILDTLRGPDRSQVIVISGASGCGKSSLLRAGLIPRLRRKPDWVVISPFEVASEPLRNLLERLADALAGLGVPTQGLDLTKPPDDPTIFARVLDETLRRLERARPATDAWVLLPLDQAEALVASDVHAPDQSRLLLDALVQVLGRRTRHAILAATIRTEFVPRLEAIVAGPEVRLLQAPLSAIGSLSEVIEKPANRFGIELEPGLSGRIVEDVRTADALPLLAYTLRALNESGGANRRLTLDEYRTLGGVQGAIGAKLQSVLSDPKPTAGEIQSLRRAFTRYLIRVDEGAVEGERLLRRVVPRASLPQQADRVIRRLVDAGLLVTRDGTIELAHERLIDDWPKLTLRKWLNQDSTDRRLIDRLRERVNDDTLSDGLLGQAEELLQRDYELAAEEPALAKLVQRSRDQKNEIRIQRDKARAGLLAMQARRAAESDTADYIELAGALALESIAVARKSNLPAEVDAIEAANSALVRLPLAVLSHGDDVSSLAVLEDGRLVSSGYDGTIKLWPEEGAGEPVVLSHGSLVSCLAVLADGRLASGGEDGTIKLWPKQDTGDPVVLSHGSPVRAMAVLADGRLASGDYDGKIKLWPKDGTGPPVIRSHGSGSILSLAVLADGRLASSSSSYDGEIKLWPKEGTGEPVLLSHVNWVQSMAVLADGRLASGGEDGTIKLWPEEGMGEPVVLSHGSPVRAMAVLADGRLASGDYDGKIKLWPKDGTGPPVIRSHGSLVSCLAVLADGRLASGGQDGTIRLWPEDGTGEPVVLSHDLVSSLAVLVDGRLASGGNDGTIKLWPEDGTGEPVLLSHGRWVESMAVLADGRLASGDDNGKIKLWPKDGKGEPVVLWHGSTSVLSLAVLTDSRLVAGSYDGSIKLWPKDGTGPAVDLRHGSSTSSLAVLADGRLASGGYDGKIKLWPKEGTAEGARSWQEREISRSKGRIAQTAELVDMLKGEPVVLSHDSSVLSLAVLEDGRLASGSEDGTIKLWPKQDTGDPVVLSHGSPVRAMAVLADGRLASGGGDGTIKLWPKDGTGPPVIRSHGSSVWSLAALADGRLASAGSDDKIKLWLVDEQKLIAALCLRAGRNLTKDEWAHYIGSDTPWQPSCRNLPSNWRTPDP